jgi:hypothetical protein
MEKDTHSIATTVKPCRSAASIAIAVKISTITTTQEEKGLGY